MFGGNMTSRQLAGGGGMTNRAGGKRRESVKGQGRRRSVMPEADSAAMASDVWSFGCLIAFVDTGQPPYSQALHDMATQPRMTPSRMLITASRTRDHPLSRLRSKDHPCPALVLKIAERCVDDDPHHRPAASYLYNEFKKGPKLLEEAANATAVAPPGPSSIGPSVSSNPMPAPQLPAPGGRRMPAPQTPPPPKTALGDLTLSPREA